MLRFYASPRRYAFVPDGVEKNDWFWLFLWCYLVAIAFLVLMSNLVTLWIGDFATHYAALVGKSYSFFYTIMVFTMVLSLIFVTLFAILVFVKQTLQQR